MTNSSVKITAEITGIEYKILLENELPKIDINAFNINTIPSCCVVSDGKKGFAISKWVSPKRTRSYPYERVYRTLSFSKKITVIPVVKDEGFDGDRDFIQWDTISLMSLLDVYVILAYYDNAEKHLTRKNKITNQKFNNEYIVSKIKEISSYHSSALHWNLKEIQSNLSTIISKVQESYALISKKLRTRLHNEKGLEDFKKQLEEDVKFFMETSRKKAEEAQAREMRTQQPKESLQTLSKSKITITNYLGGKYFLTIDEIKILKNGISLIESKHSKRSLLPSKNDIKDGLLKMILFSNLKNVAANKRRLPSFPILNLTSTKLKANLNSDSSILETELFFKKNKFSSAQKSFVTKLFSEAKANNFSIILQNG
jgi:hypothetical protein